MDGDDNKYKTFKVTGCSSCNGTHFVSAMCQGDGVFRAVCPTTQVGLSLIDCDNSKDLPQGERYRALVQGFSFIAQNEEGLGCIAKDLAQHLTIWRVADGMSYCLVWATSAGEALDIASRDFEGLDSVEGVTVDLLPSHEVRDLMVSDPYFGSLHVSIIVAMSDGVGMIVSSSMY